MNTNVREKKIGMKFINNQGCECTIVDYIRKEEVYVVFEGTEPIKCHYSNLRKGSVKNPLYPSVYGVGCLGQGVYESHLKGGRANHCYETWKGMLRRCYSDEFQKKQPAYIGCSVCEEWHNYQNFAKWYEENYYEVDGERMELDKDILVKGNKIYSPTTCVFVSQRINKLILKRENARGETPMGVFKGEGSVSFESYCKTGGKVKVRLGSFNTSEEAFQAYKEFKEQYIKQVAEEYKDKIPTKLYNALRNWKVEITD